MVYGEGGTKQNMLLLTYCIINNVSFLRKNVFTMFS